jgi:hypothetical protein
MRNTMRISVKLCSFVFVVAASALAQSRWQSGPSPAVAGPSYDLSVGYSYLSMPIASAGRVGLNGVDFSGTLSVSSRWAATLDSSYLRTSDVLSTPHQGYLLTLRTGPVFSLIQHRNTQVFVRGLGGVGLVDGAVPISDTSYFHGWLMRPSFLAGLGAQRAVSDQLAIRVNGDYVRTTFCGANGTAQPQNNLQLTVSFVVRLKQHQRRSSSEVR